MKRTIITLVLPLSFLIQSCSAMEQQEGETEILSMDEAAGEQKVKKQAAEASQEMQIPLIHKAVEDEDFAQIQQLIEKKVSLNRRDGKLQTALHRAVRLGNVDIAQLLLENKAEASLQDDEGDTPLHIATRQNAVLMAIILMTFNASVDARNNEGEAAMHIAARKDCPSIVDLLLQAGASPDLKTDTKGGITAFEIAKQNGNTDIMLQLRAASRIAKTELEKGTFTGYAKQGAIKATNVLLRDPQIQQGILRGFLVVARGTLNLTLRTAARTVRYAQNRYAQSKCEIL